MKNHQFSLPFRVLFFTTFALPPPTCTSAAGKIPSQKSPNSCRSRANHGHVPVWWFSVPPTIVVVGGVASSQQQEALKEGERRRSHAFQSIALLKGEVPCTNTTAPPRPRLNLAEWRRREHWWPKLVGSGKSLQGEMARAVINFTIEYRASTPLWLSRTMRREGGGVCYRTDKWRWHFVRFLRCFIDIIIV